MDALQTKALSAGRESSLNLFAMEGLDELALGDSGDDLSPPKKKSVKAIWTLLLLVMWRSFSRTTRWAGSFFFISGKRCLSTYCMTCLQTS